MFWFSFPWQLMVLSIFSRTCWPSVCLLWKKKMSIQIFFPFFNWIIWVLLLSCMSFLHILEIAPYQIHDLQLFSLIQLVAFPFVEGFLCCAEAFWLDVVPLIYFHFCSFCFWCHIKKNHHQESCQETYIYVFFWKPYGFRYDGQVCILS